MIINTDFDIDDEVWLINKNKAVSGKIIKISIAIHSEEEYITYKVKLGFSNNINRKAIDLFKTKEDLLKSL